MPENKNAVYEILERRVEPKLLHGFLAGELDEEAGRLYGSTFVKISDIDYDDYHWALYGISSGGFSSTGADQKEDKIFYENGSYSMKDRNACVKEGVYISYTVKFYGAHVQGQWYILKELTYFGTRISEEEARTIAQYGFDKQPILDAPIYWPIEKYNSVISKTERLRAEDVEFKGFPWLVAHLKQQEKEALCRAFTQYFNLEVFFPFKNRLMADLHEEFAGMHTYMGDLFLTIYPQTKEFVLIPTLVGNTKKEYRLYYFFWHAEKKKMYKWTYFTPAIHGRPFFFGSIILDDLKQISAWNDYDYLNSSCTMDDYGFWMKYVLAEENERYKYLVEM